MISRREFVLAAGASFLLNPQDSGLLTGKLKKPGYDEIPGLFSKEQVEPHVQAHYGGALKAFNEIEETFAKLYKGETKVEKREYRELQQERVSRANSVILHEFYFDNIAARPPDPPADVRRAIADRFGSLERWVDDFKACANAAQGWAMLVHHPINKKLYNIVLDMHDIGPMAMEVPLALIDVYEHAYYVDYKNRKGDYVGNFVKFLDWDEINRRYQSATK